MQTNGAAVVALPVLLVVALGAHAQTGSLLTLSIDEGLSSEAARQPESPAAKTPPDGQPAPPDAEAPQDAPRERIGFGLGGASYLTFGAGYMNNFEDDQAGQLYLGYSHFIADEIEFNVELGGWYFNQEGNDTGGVSAIMNFRWHFLHDEAFDWTVYGEFGFGVLFAFDNVPESGTGFNFLPRAGAGFTKLLDDEGTRLMVGVRWQHLSNGRIEGDDRNPGRDSLMVYAGVMFPF